MKSPNITVHGNTAAAPSLSQILDFMADRYTTNMDELICVFSGSRNDIKRTLNEMIHAGKIEQLRPVGCDSEEYDYYRLTRNTDASFLWQQELEPTAKPIRREENIQWQR